MKTKALKTESPARASDRAMAKHAASNGNGTGKPVAYGSHELSDEILTVAQQPVRMPREDKELIRALAITRGHSGEPECCDYHTRSIDSSNAELLEQCRRLDEQVRVEESGAQRHIEELTRILEHTDRYREQAEPTVPWTNFDIVQIVLLALMSLVLLAVGINTNASVLQSSGIPVFENLWRAYLFSFIPVGLAVAVKMPGSHIALKSRRLAYTYGVWGLGLLFGVVWAVQFANTFPGMTQSTADIIASLTDPSAGANQGHSNNSFVLVAMLAEVFLAGGCWLTIQLISEKHAPCTRTDNPAYLKAQSDLTHWQRRQAENRRLAGILAGKIRAINEAREQFVGGAMAYFRAAVKLAVNDKHLDDFLNR